MFHNNIYYSDEPVLSDAMCAGIIQAFESSPDKHPGYIGSSGKMNKIDNTIKKSTDLRLNNYPEKYTRYCDYLTEKTVRSLEHYSTLLRQQTPSLDFSFIRHGTDLTGFNVQRTDTDGYFTWHSDDYIADNMQHRGIAYILYLNTTEGGTTEFYDGTVIHPKQGHVLLFPSTWTYIHCGKPPISGSKYIITGWWMVRGPVHSHLKTAS